MKKLIMLVCSAVLLLSVPAYAQSGDTPDRNEVVQLSAGLKEAYGYLSKNLAMLDREIGPNADAASASQKSEREELTGMIAQVEGALASVNSSNRAQWAEVKAKSEAIRKRALDIVERKANQ
jgi:hypothetical protein